MTNISEIKRRAGIVEHVDDEYELNIYPSQSHTAPFSSTGTMYDLMDDIRDAFDQDFHKIEIIKIPKR